MKSFTDTRRTAAFILSKWLATREFPSAMLPEGQDRAFVQDMVYTAIRRLRALRFALGDFVRQWPKGELESLLYIGAAQILYMDDVPDFAAVNETVNAAKGCENPSIARVVNGVLRNLLRNLDAVKAKIAAAGPEVKESFPSAIARRWKERFGEERAAKLMAWHNLPAVTFIAGADGSFHALERGRKVGDSQLFAQGKAIVQNPSTANATNLLGVEPGERVLDACAAPGGKTIRLAWAGAKVTACEVNPKRRERLVENLRRTGLEEKVRVIDSLEELAPGETFAKVLADVPCSNTGVFRRRPDARWNWSEEKLAALERLQAEIADWCAKFVAPGGSLVYSTCSNEPEENQFAVKAFLERNPGFALAEEIEHVPGEGDADGAYAARLVKSQTISTTKENKAT